MKIPNLMGKDYQTILKTVKGISAASKRSDEQAIEKGELIKYVVEIYNKKNVLNEVREMYSKSHVFRDEVLSSLGLSSSNFQVQIRGPFPLVEGALADSKLNRWESEKEKAERDSSIVERHFSEAEDKQYKYGYIIYEEVMGVKRFAELKFTDKAMPKYKIDRLLKASPHGHKRSVLRIRLSNGQEKLYQ